MSLIARKSPAARDKTPGFSNFSFCALAHHPLTPLVPGYGEIISAPRQIGRDGPRAVPGDADGLGTLRVARSGSGASVSTGRAAAPSKREEGLGGGSQAIERPRGRRVGSGGRALGAREPLFGKNESHFPKRSCL